MIKIEENKRPVNEQKARNLILQIQSGDAEAETRLVELHKGFTASVTRQYQEQGLTEEEMTSACESALKRAAHKFDLNKHFAFISYAIWWMREGILQALKAKRSHVIKK